MSQSVTATRTRTNTRTGHCRQEYTHRCLSSMPIKISNTGDTLLWGRAWGIGTTEHATRAVERTSGEEREGEEGTEVKHTLRATTYEPLISRETRVLVSLWRKLFPTSILRFTGFRVFEKLVYSKSCPFTPWHVPPLGNQLGKIHPGIANAPVLRLYATWEE